MGGFAQRFKHENDLCRQRKVLVVSEADRRRRLCDRTLLAGFRNPMKLGI
jgi:hypothetical protein